MIFTDVERDYLAGQIMGRFASIGPDGTPQVRPMAFRLNADGTIDTGAVDPAKTKRYRNVRRNPRVSFVVDDLNPDKTYKPGRGVEIRGRAETLRVDDPPGPPGLLGNEIIRLHPTRVMSWGIDPDNPDGESRSVA